MPKLKLEEFDRLYSSTEPAKFAKLVEQLLKEPKKIAEDAKKLKTELTKELADAKQREANIKAISQAKFFIKFKQGVSDALKAKCLPRNKTTQTTIEKQLKELADFVGTVGLALGYGENLQGTSSISANARKIFVENYNKAVDGFEALAQKLRGACAAAEAKEKEATDVLDKYLAEKGTAKELGGTDYKDFKKRYDAIAKTL
ncbi:MAG: hypothetical protein JNM56_14780 [Planctomycetia bacterium]|nr:hypothetical protein [Planctomycetia bacterium]